MAEVVLQDYRQIVLVSGTPTTASGSAVFDGFGSKELNLIINVTASPTGTTPSITFSINEVDPGDQLTTLGNSASGAAITTGPTTQIVSLPVMYSGTVKVSWTVTGTTPSFAVYASLVSKNAGTTTLYSATGGAVTGTAGTPGTAVVSVQGVAGGTSVPVSISNVDRTSTGTITSTQNVNVNSQGSGVTGVEVTGTWTGTLSFQASVDGTTWNAVSAVVPTTGAIVTSTTANGVWLIPSAGYQSVRVLGNTVATGTATVALDNSSGTNLMILADSLPTGSNVIGAVTQSGGPWTVSGTVTANQGTAAALAGAWPVEITDGTNVLGTSTHPVFVTGSTTGDRQSTGTITNTQNVAVNTEGEGNVSVVIGATAFTGTLVFEGLAGDAATWVAVLAYNNTNGEPVTSVTANGNYTIPCAGYEQIRVRGNTVASGTATIALNASAGAPGAIFTATGGLASAGSTAVGWPSLIAPLTDNNLVGQLALGEAYRLRVGNESLGFLENFDGSTINTVRWTQSNLTMTQTQATTAFTFNANATTTASTYSILTSTKSFMYSGEYATECRIKAQLTAQANSVIELGFLSCATTAAPTNGVFFRITSAGVQELVINYNGTETTSAAITPALTAANYYTFVIYMYGTIARLDILNWDNSLFATTTVQIPATQNALINTGHIPVAIRVYNTATPPASAPKIIATGVTVSQLDLAGEKDWTVQLADIMRFANTDPLTGAQLQNYANNAAPTTIASGSLSNTAAAYTTLGGGFAFNPPASSENDFIIFGYQVPSGFDLMIWSITIQSMILVTQSTTTPHVYEWGVAVGSSAVSLATAGANPPIRQIIGMQQSPKSASIGDSLNPAQLIWTPHVPITCYGGKFVHIFFRPISSNATANQVVRGCVTVDGAFQ